MSQPGRNPSGEERGGRAALLRLLRVSLFALIVAIIGLYVVDLGGQQSALDEFEFRLVAGWPYVLMFAIVLALGVLAIDILTPEKKISTLSGLFLGLVAGVLAALAVGYLIDRLADLYEVSGTRLITTIKILFGIALTYLAVSIVLQTQDQFRLIIPYVEFTKQQRGPKPILLDTSALIDARIVSVMESGLVQAPIVVARFVVGELQTLADSSDKLKRARGRRGLDVVTALQRSPALDVSIDETPVQGKSVDQMLVDLARTMNAIIVTTDQGLSRVAQIHQVRSVNVFELANALKTDVIPGEPLSIRVVKIGEQPGQGVGYLDDGTMVVVEDGGDSISEQVTVVVTSSMQTTAGRLIFARLSLDAEEARLDAPAPEEIPDDGEAAGADESAAQDGRRDDLASRREGPLRKPPRSRAGTRNPRRR